jgi:hypothetical protein
VNLVTAVIVFLLLGAVDLILGVVVSCIKLKQPFSLGKLPAQFEQAALLLVSQAVGLYEQAQQPGGSLDKNAFIALVLGAAATGSARFIRDILAKALALFESSPQA